MKCKNRHTNKELFSSVFETQNVVFELISTLFANLKTKNSISSFENSEDTDQPGFEA